MFFIGFLIALLYLKKYLPFWLSDYPAATGHSYWKTMTHKGFKGEYELFRTLESLPIPKILFANLYIPKEDGTTSEVDIVMLTQHGVYVFEMKNYAGWVYGNEKHRYWTQTFPNRKKYRFFNPVWQNKAHQEAIMKYLCLNSENQVKNWIIFGNNCRLKTIKVEETSVHIFPHARLLEELKKEILSSPKTMGREEIKRQYKLLNNCVHVSKTIKTRHIQLIKEKTSTQNIDLQTS